VATPALATKDEPKEEKVNICHATSSESNPWNAIQVNESAVQTHLDEHGDFYYEGAVDDKGKPVKEGGDEWCENNVPEEENGNGNGNGHEEEPRDVCPNIEGNQEELPNDKILDDEGNCVDVPGEPKEPTEPEATPSATPEIQSITELPQTGGISTFAWVVLAFALGGVVGWIGARFKP